MSSMSRVMSDRSVREDVDENRSSSGSFRTDGSVSGALESFFVGPSATVKGNYNAASTLDFTRELRSHAESSHERSEPIGRASCRERGCQYVSISVVAVTFKQKKKEQTKEEIST